MTIVDVRTSGEYHNGNVPGSLNIPLGEISSRLKDFLDLEMPIVLCCASGNRSGQATQYLQENGITCENGGSWMNLNSL